MTKVIVAGANGAMGKKVVNLIKRTEGFELDAVYDPHANLRANSSLDSSIHTFNSLDNIKTDAQIWVDFTVPAAAYTNTKFALDHNISPIIGTTGMSDQEQQALVDLSRKKQIGGIIAPNFGLSAVLLMKFAAEAAKYFPDAEVIEMHHADKKDAPSGTALETAKLIAANREGIHSTENQQQEKLAGALGGDYHGIKIHSVRLPGYIAHEQVLFGGTGEALTIRQDSFDRESFMSGVRVALQKVLTLNHIVLGLDKIL